MARVQARQGVITVLLAAVVGCAGSGVPVVQDPPAPRPTMLDTVEVTLRAPKGDAVRLRVEDAFEPGTRRRGLMYRRHLEPRGGMLFRYPRDRTGGYWMKNTLLPLSIAFFDADGEILAVLDMEPCATQDCPTYDPDVTYRGALEVNQGLFDEIGVTRGWRVELPAGLPPAR